jgi:hypothetical protein
MREVTEADIRASFVNCSKGEAQRLPIPRDLAERPWDELDFLGWKDPGAPQRRYLVAERDGQLVGLVLRAAPNPSPRVAMCSICHTNHRYGGVTLMTAAKTGASGARGNSVGTYLCADLSCSLYLRGMKPSSPERRRDELLDLDAQLERTRARLYSFIDSVQGG